ncbi:SAM-dependent methyltransferase [bacterium]|nr:SAM-dependent methyltransferase [bacterium]
MTNNDLPDSTAVRVALWRAIHVQADAPPHVFVDDVGFRLVEPAEGWKERPDMHPVHTRRFRASILVRSRFMDDLVIDSHRKAIHQYVVLGAGLDSFAQRRANECPGLKIFEVDKPATQAWKKRRLQEIGLQTSGALNFVPINFENATSLWGNLAVHGFNKSTPAIVSSLGVSMYLTKNAIEDTLCDMSQLAPGSRFVMTFMLPLELVDPEDQPGYRMSLRGAESSGTPFISFFAPEEMKTLAASCGFSQVEHFSTVTLGEKYFSGRDDGLRPSTGEEILVLAT